MQHDSTLPYLPIRLDCVLPATPLRDPVRHERFTLPWWRLNLLACQNDALYVAGPSDSASIYVYVIMRICSYVTVHPVGVREVNQNAHINNIASAVTDDGRSYLIAAGGDPLQIDGRGTLTVLPLENDDGDLSSGCEGGRDIPRPGLTAKSTTVELPCKSVWGIDSSPDCKVLAIGSNSHRTLLLRFNPGDESTCSTELRSPLLDLVGHVSNIPCVSFTPPTQSPTLLMTASVDTTFCVYDVDSGEKVYQDGRATEVAFSTREHWCWAVRWLRPELFKPVSRDDAMWKALEFKPQLGIVLDRQC
jgi:CRT10